MPDEVTDPDLKKVALLSGTQNFSLEEARAQREHVTGLLDALHLSYGKIIDGKNRQALFLIAGNLIQVAVLVSLLVGGGIDFSGFGVNVKTDPGSSAEPSAPDPVP